MEILYTIGILRIPSISKKKERKTTKKTKKKKTWDIFIAVPLLIPAKSVYIALGNTTMSLTKSRFYDGS